MHVVILRSETGWTNAATSWYKNANIRNSTSGISARTAIKIIPATPIPFLSSTATPNATSIVPPATSPIHGTASSVRPAAVIFKESIAGFKNPRIRLIPLTAAMILFRLHWKHFYRSSANSEKRSSPVRQDKTLTIP